MESKLRERKLHQQYFKNRYEQNMKQQEYQKKKIAYANKNDGKKNIITAYDFDGTIIQNNTSKQESVKIPIHFLDLEVVVEK